MSLGAVVPGHHAMAYKVTYSSDEGCVHARIEGAVDLALAQRYAREIITQLRAHHCLRLRNDMRQASLKLSTMDLYDLPAWIEERLEEAGVSRSCKRALLVARDFRDYEFYETVSRNHGHLLEVFADAEITGIFRDTTKADEWLGIAKGRPASRRQYPLPSP